MSEEQKDIDKKLEELYKQLEKSREQHKNGEHITIEELIKKIKEEW